MSVTQEDGGRLNAFAIEPRMSYAEPATDASNSKRLLLIGAGALIVIAMTVVAVGIS